MSTGPLPNDPEPRDAQSLALVAAVVDTDARWAPSLDAMAAVASMVRARPRVSAGTPWLQARPVSAVRGVRAVGDLDSVVHCRAEEFTLMLVPRHTPEADACALHGQLVDPMGQPMEGLEVGWIVDDKGVATAVTDEFGEFAFDEAHGASFGVRIKGPDWTRHVRLPAVESA